MANLVLKKKQKSRILNEFQLVAFLLRSRNLPGGIPSKCLKTRMKVHVEPKPVCTINAIPDIPRSYFLQKRRWIFLTTFSLL